MATFHEVAKEVGLNPVECPYCHKQIQTGDLLYAVWQAALRRLRRGENFTVRGVGKFSLTKTKARWIRTPLFPEPRKISARVYLSFRQSKNVSKFLNKRRRWLDKPKRKRLEETKESN